MLEQAFDQGSVHRWVEAVTAALDRDDVREAAARAAQQIPGDGPPEAKLRAALPSPGPVNQSSGGVESPVVPYLSRSPAVSLVQSAIEESLRQEGVIQKRDVPPDLWHRVTHTIEELLHPGTFSPDDPNWVVKVVLAVLGHLARGNHPFNPRPAHHEISDTARLVVVGDWGTGLPRARAVAGHMAQAVTEALDSGRQAHVIHLGDVYYSGLPSEDQRHVLDPWPVTTEHTAAGVTSWSLNGNHDMYSGGYGYFQTLLADPRFAAQHSPDGAPTSYFRLTSPSWDFIGLDTSWDPDILSHGTVAVLEDPQADFVATVAAEATRKLALFSHHQFVSVYEPSDIGPELTRKLGPVLDHGRVTAWWWGHEHRNMGFASTTGVEFPRCLGNGGVPVLQPHAPDDPIPPPGAWENRSFLESDGRHWARFGYAILDADGPNINVRYLDETGDLVHAENIT
jgi:hypothetical protein